MIISRGSQLGLMFDHPQLQKDFYEILLKRNTELRDIVHKGMETVKDGMVTLKVPEEEISNFDLPNLENQIIIQGKATEAIGEVNIIDGKNSRWFLIRESVEKCADMIRINENFSSTIFRKIKNGKHTYLLGKYEMVRFYYAKGYIKGFYFNTAYKIAFEFGFDTMNEGYYFDGKYPEQFNKVARLMTFIELGDVEVIVLEQGRNNGKQKNDGKVTNQSDFKVYVVDSSWNKLIIRTEGFAVRGHFRLQPCGEGFSDRKLIWINAFEKHGYIRRPKSAIIN